MLIHIVIVSGQTLPNLIPALMERPGEVWLVTSSEMSGKRHDRRLRRMLEKDGVAVRSFPDAPESGFHSIQDYACKIADQAISISGSSSLALNLSGGTKLMTLAFFDVFRGIAHRIIYTDTSNGRIEVLPEEKGGDAMQNLADSRLVRREGGEWFEFVDAEAAQFLNGGWLEEYAWHILKDESPFDVRLRVEGIWDDTKKTTNELDVVAVHGNRMLLVECKTLKHGRDTVKDSDILYKIDSLSEDTRGLFGETWLLSAREPTEFMRDRARHQNIRVIGPGALPGLKSRVRDWMSRCRIG